MKVISLKWFISCVTHLLVPRTPESLGVCSLLFSFLLLVKVTSSIGREMGLVLHRLLFEINESFVGCAWAAMDFFIFAFQLMRVSVVGLRNPIARLNVRSVSCVLLRLALLLLAKRFILDNSCRGEFVMPGLWSQVCCPLPWASVSPWFGHI